MKRYLILMLIFAVSAAGHIYTQSDSSGFDILPIGPSAYKLIIDKVEKDQIKQSTTGNEIKIEDIFNSNPDTDVFIIGEAHDNYRCHTFQRDFIEVLFEKHPKIIVGFEFFWREDNEALEQWRNGTITEEELIKKTGWYKRGSQNYGYTKLIMDLIRKYKIKTIGLNVPRSILRAVSTKGFDKLSAEEKKLFPTIDIPNPEHEYFIKSVFGAFAVQVPSWFKNIYNAQKCWDVIMAESMRQILEKKEFKGYKGVIIAGSNHAAYKLGIPFRYQKAAPKTKITTIMPVLIPEEKKEEKEGEENAHPMMKMMGNSLKPAAIYSRGIADYVFSAEQPIYSHFPVLGLSIEESNGKLIVTGVTKKSIAEVHGLSKDDQITSLDGIAVTSLEQFRTLMSMKNWDDTVTLGFIKKITIKKK